MFRRLLIAILVLLPFALMIWGNRLTAELLNARLPPLLSEQLGVPVVLAPVSAQLLSLSVSTPSVRMGDVRQPVVTATEVTVSLSWYSLLRGEIRLSNAQAGDLVVQPSRWPSSESSDDDYTFLDPWLPARLSVQNARYLDEAASTYSLENLNWRRHLGEKASLSWQQLFATHTVQFEAKLDSLPNILALRELQLDLAVSADKAKASALALQLKLSPATSGYTLAAALQAAALRAQISASGSEAWQLPQSSSTAIDSVSFDALQNLAAYYQAPSASRSTEELLASSVPALDFVAHSGQLTIASIDVGGQTLATTELNFSMDAGTIRVNSLSSQAPHGKLTGEAALHSGEQGWQLDLNADLIAQAAGQSLAAQYLQADWLLHSGHTRLTAQGSSWGALLDSMNGNMTLQGQHLGTGKTPLEISATIQQRAGSFALDPLLVTVGKAKLGGSVALSGGTERKLSVVLRGDHLDLGFLAGEPDNSVGILIPEYLTALPGIDISWNAQLDGLQLADATLSQVEFLWERKPQNTSVKAAAVDPNGGKISVTLAATTPTGQATTLDVNVALDKAHFARLFRQGQGLLDVRTSGLITLQSQGTTVADIFNALQGKARLELDLRNDGDWTRNSVPNERVTIAGLATLIIEGDKILGLNIDELAIESLQQDLTGKLTMIAGREPWLTADLHSKSLSISNLRDAMPNTPDSTSENSLQDLQQLGAIGVSLQVESLEFQSANLANVELEVASRAGQFAIERLGFGLGKGRVDSRAQISWEQGAARLTASAEVKDFSLDPFVLPESTQPPIPVSGIVKLQSKGEDFQQLLSQVSGSILLQHQGRLISTPPADRRQLDIKIAEIDNGMKAKINALVWGESSVQGDLRYINSVPAQIELEITGGSISLQPWEQEPPPPPPPVAKKKKNRPKVVIEEIASDSASAAEKALTSPARLATGKGSTTAPRYFSNTPFPLDTLRKYNANIKGKLDSISSELFVAREVALDVQLADAKLKASLNAGFFNGGTLVADLGYDASTEPQAATLTASLDKVYHTPEQTGSAYSGYMALHSQGASESTLAAGLNGISYAELGPGPFEFKGAPLLTADVASSIMRVLIPGSDNQLPQLQCAVTLASFKNGIGVTPYGYAAQTRRANLIGRLELDLGKETMVLKFDSQSREGVGLSLGSVFSNTVQLKGPISNPSVVPDAAGLLWRSWAAFATAGLSVVGESMLKRTLTSKDPCADVQEAIRKDLCGNDSPAAASPLICPKG